MISDFSASACDHHVGADRGWPVLRTNVLYRLGGDADRVNSVNLVLAACTSALTPVPTAAPSGGGGSGNSASSGATVNTAATSKGTVLAGPTGVTLYTYAKDSDATSACGGGCATAWPPLTVPAGQAPTAGPGVARTLATLTRADGTVQVTYNGWPLYYWKGDKAAGDVTGDGVNSFAVATPTIAAAPMGAPSASPSGKPGY